MGDGRLSDMYPAPLFLAALVVTVGPCLAATSDMSAAKTDPALREGASSFEFRAISRPWGEPCHQRPHQTGRVQGMYGVFRV